MSESPIQKRITVDTHVHSEHSHDSQASIADILATSEKAGPDIVCITDHCDIEYCAQIDVETVIAASIADAKRHNTSGRVRILSGVEIGEAIWNPKQAKRIVALEGLDQVIGSVHAVRFEGYPRPYSRIDFSAFTSEELDAYMTTYFNDVLEMAETADFDILAHLTCPLRYINGKYGRDVDCHRYRDKIHAILSEIIRRGIALEVNTSNCGSHYDEFMPEEWIIRLYRDLGGKHITCGSDAHIPENIAHQFDRLYRMLAACGFDHACYFKARCMQTYSIKDR